MNVTGLRIHLVPGPPFYFGNAVAASLSRNYLNTHRNQPPLLNLNHHQPRFTSIHFSLKKPLPTSIPMDAFGFGMMSFMPGDYLDMADVAFWDDTPGYEELPHDMYEVDQYGAEHEDIHMEERRPIEEDWVEDETRSVSTRSATGRSIAAVSTGREDTLAPSSRNPGYAEERRTLGPGAAHACLQASRDLHNPI